MTLGARAGKIVEVEAYLGYNEWGEPDLAAHSSRGVTPRTQVIFGEPGHAYVYLIYGMYECLNIVAEPAGKPGCVLLRALEPLSGSAAMNGPGKLTRAMEITRALNGADVTRGPLAVYEPESSEPFAIDVTPRIGIRQCADWPLRFCLRGSPYLSRKVPVL